MPVREVPRDVHGERARSDDQEDRGTDDRGGALHDRSIPNAAANRADSASAGVAFTRAHRPVMPTSRGRTRRRTARLIQYAFYAVDPASPGIAYRAEIKRRSPSFTRPADCLGDPLVLAADSQRVTLPAGQDRALPPPARAALPQPDPAASPTRPVPTKEPYSHSPPGREVPPVLPDPP